MIFRLSGVRKRRDAAYTLSVSSFSVRRGEYVALTGPSGCGKSTALDLLGMVLRPDGEGCFELYPHAAQAGEDPGAVDVLDLWRRGALDEMAALRRRYMGYVLQTGELLPFLNVEQNILIAASLKNMSAEGARDSAEELMQTLCVTHVRSAMPASLSVGERQRVAVARALVGQPAVILADEPTAALDPRMARQVMSLFLETVQKSGAALVMVSHDIGLVREFGLRETSVGVLPHGEGVTAVIDDGAGREA